MVCTFQVIFNGPAGPYKCPRQRIGYVVKLFLLKTAYDKAVLAPATGFKHDNFHEKCISVAASVSGAG